MPQVRCVSPVKRTERTPLLASAGSSGWSEADVFEEVRSCHASLR
jgi:hypothetical protein